MSKTCPLCAANVKEKWLSPAKFTPKEVCPKCKVHYAYKFLDDYKKYESEQKAKIWGKCDWCGEVVYYGWHEQAVNADTEEFVCPACYVSDCKMSLEDYWLEK